MTSRKEYTKGEYLPEKLVQKLHEVIFDNSRYEYCTKNNFLQCIAIIFHHEVTQTIGLNNYVEQNAQNPTSRLLIYLKQKRLT